MPNYTADVNPNSLFARMPERKTCGCKGECTCGAHKPPMPPMPPCPETGYWCPPPPYYPPFPEGYPYDCPPTPCGNSIEAQIAKLSKKASIIRKMIENLTKKNKSIIMTIGCSKYNFGTYMNKEEEVTDYGDTVLEMLEAELAAIKAKIIELTGELEVEEDDVLIP